MTPHLAELGDVEVVSISGRLEESFKEVMHTKCKGCYQKEKKGPTKCDDSHKK